MPHWVYLRTGLKTAMLPFERDPARVDVLLDSASVNYVVLDGTLTESPLIRRNMSRLWCATLRTAGSVFISVNRGAVKSIGEWCR